MQELKIMLNTLNEKLSFSLYIFLLVLFMLYVAPSLFNNTSKFLSKIIVESYKNNLTEYFTKSYR